MVKQIDDIHIRFSCPDGFTVTVGVQLEAGDLVLSLPEQFRSNAPYFGLLGTSFHISKGGQYSVLKSS